MLSFSAQSYKPTDRNQYSLINDEKRYPLSHQTANTAVNVPLSGKIMAATINYFTDDAFLSLHNGPHKNTFVFTLKLS